MRFYPAKISGIFKFTSGFSHAGDCCWSVEGVLTSVNSCIHFPQDPRFLVLECCLIILHPFLPSWSLFLGPCFPLCFPSTTLPPLVSTLTPQSCPIWGCGLFIHFVQLYPPTLSFYILLEPLDFYFHPWRSLQSHSDWPLDCSTFGWASCFSMWKELLHMNWSPCELMLYFELHLSHEDRRWWSQNT